MRRNYGRRSYGNRRYYGGLQSTRKKSYQSNRQRLLQLAKDMAKVEAGKKNADSQIHEVYTNALSENNTAKKPLY